MSDLDNKAEIVGIAYNTTELAMIVSEDHRGAFMLDGLDRWPSEMVNKRVAVSGVVRAVKGLSPKDKEDGPIQGATGTRRYIINYLYELK